MQQLGGRAAPQKPLAVLVVEDEPYLRLSVADSLRDADFQVFEAANSDEAITILNEGCDIRLVCTDVNMPGAMDGYRLAAYVGAKWPSIKLIVTSGRVAPGATDLPSSVPFLSKPYDTRRLVNVIAAMIATEHPS